MHKIYGIFYLCINELVIYFLSFHLLFMFVANWYVCWSGWKCQISKRNFLETLVFCNMMAYWCLYKFHRNPHRRKLHENFDYHHGGVTPLSSWTPHATKKNLILVSCTTKMGQNLIKLFFMSRYTQYLWHS